MTKERDLVDLMLFDEKGKRAANGQFHISISRVDRKTVVRTCREKKSRRDKIVKSLSSKNQRFPRPI